MTEKLKEYQVLDVFCGGTFYKVRHKVTNNIFAWKAYNCSAYSDSRIQDIVADVKTINKVISDCLLRYFDTILHGPSRTLYFVVEYSCWQSARQLLATCAAEDLHFAESFLWRLLFELARLCNQVDDLKLAILQKCITTDSIYVSERGEFRVNCFDLTSATNSNLVRQVGDVLHALSFRTEPGNRHVKKFHYSDDLQDIISFLTDEKNSELRPNVILYHPTVLSNIETLSGAKPLKEILVSADYRDTVSEGNKCDSEKAVELCRTVKPLPRKPVTLVDSPIYCNVSPKHKQPKSDDFNLSTNSLSPTLAALALELPGFVPRSRRPYSEALQKYTCPKQVSEETLSQQWMSCLVALRQREESLNQRERELVAKEILNSPSTKIITLNESLDVDGVESNGITLPPMLSQVGDERMSRRRRRTSSTRVKPRRKSYAYEDLDSSLSADAGDGSVIITAKKFTKDNMPRRNIFPEVSSKKVHFTSVNPFVESDDSVTLTFYELENMDSEYEKPKEVKDISKFKYLDVDKITSEKRVALNWSQGSPSKQAKTSNAFVDITNTSQASIRKTPSKASLMSKSSNTSKSSAMSIRSQWSVDSGISEGNVCDRTRGSMRQSMMQTPKAPPEAKKAKRKSLLPFKTPFKFKTSTKL
ncbi:uncharacterized protein LOC106140671 [Amyelois transitella]|uniref:uncharacterized protein LOC106140671 n=1 Tax=Amyelois transitella TaxID=680683 RepID=UPI00298F9376|nr:uncharacterized protein LOC106140671 [Amyelois transitella]